MKRFYCFLIALIIMGMIVLTVKFPVFAQVVAMLLSFLLIMLVIVIVYPLIERRDD